MILPFIGDAEFLACPDFKGIKTIFVYLTVVFCEVSGLP